MTKHTHRNEGKLEHLTGKYNGKSQRLSKNKYYFLLLSLLAAFLGIIVGLTVPEVKLLRDLKVGVGKPKQGVEIFIIDRNDEFTQELKPLVNGTRVSDVQLKITKIATAIKQTTEQSSEAQMVLSYPQAHTIKTNQAFDVRLLLSHDLTKNLSRLISADSDIKPERISLPGLLSVNLDSDAEDGVIIKKQSLNVQVLSKDSTAEWDWSVLSKTPGEKKLTLTIVAVIPGNEPVSSQEILKRPIKLKVEQDFGDWLAQNGFTLVGFLVTFFSGSLTMPIILWIRSKIKRNPPGSHP